MRNGSVTAVGLGGHGAPQIYPAGRICAHDGCQVKLSIYNGAECCAPHDLSAMSSRPPRGLTRRRRRPDDTVRRAA
jgi:hypothetical protein